MVPPNTISPENRKAVRVELIGDDTCSVLGMTVRGPAPILKLCRTLVEAGIDPMPLDAYRGDTLALRVHSIGKGAPLELNGDGTGFRPRRQPDAAPPVAKSGSVGTRHRPTSKAAQ